ncbi:hydroxymethylglutaryl-CoA reductase, degradative [Lactobacillus jensenii]|jgi:hydroxymethylglutaryl-coA reductase, degradative|uniref:3-hydroxy-3-methylglutaryl coenzyme A reductase n=1 Tax=Lactobacillus jensenii TaxID=109790 RepID=A0A5N1IG17_LACJE|nr:hydroxymethylglutaryl-CoA reductase, degradative [Lactobacillus jensenii]APT14417.1 hydroxymethylglutaryl-CoA reductase, degradative [Lactobacillus jensenii]EEQ25029.1 hydroxymethylglutaryl-CoA reductase, degradative [Lactobacillus jensenii 269-3]EEX28074.1 hydroxymethylglutaryl-CoA reductase, degradative [Lactobacillus jensenii SJ-7A-US]KAA9236811.1 hydroxymethylglutaryl-CoA reductase, degradative [Lactobacillus jensenii]KAA9257861.1 hydroxymethylglutaryl-CoA reductase, degradative [Lactob
MKFYQLPISERRKMLLQNGIKLNHVDDDLLSELDLLSENVIGKLTLPLSVLQTAIVNGQSFQVPMATEESSVVAAANHGLNIFNQNGGVSAKSERTGIWGQLVFEVAEFSLAEFEAKKPDYLKLVNEEFASLVKHGGGVRQIIAEVKTDLLFLRVLVDPAESMGANRTNTILEFLGQKISQDFTIEKLYAILSNYPSQYTCAKVSLAFASLTKTKDEKIGEKIAQKIVLLSKIGQEDPYRAVTNNKGIMNGVDAILLATGNDFRAVEAACHQAASLSGSYQSLSNWRIEDNKLVGEIKLPLAIGVVGGSIKSRSDVQVAYRILRQVTASELAEIIAAVGLANNLAALLAISTVGIQKGHMSLQIRNVLKNLTATDEEKNSVKELMQKQKRYSETDAKKFLQEIREENN